MALRAFSLMLIAVAVSFTNACGSGALEGPEDAAINDTNTTSRESEGPLNRRAPGTTVPPDRDDASETENEFTWSLPGGDLSVDGRGVVFNALAAGDCSGAERELDAALANGFGWAEQKENIFRAGIGACSGDLQSGRRFLELAALTSYGGDCRIYMAVVSVLEQRQQSSVRCPDPPSENATSTSAPPSSIASDVSTASDSTTTSSTVALVPNRGTAAE